MKNDAPAAVSPATGALTVRAALQTRCYFTARLSAQPAPSKPRPNSTIIPSADMVVSAVPPVTGTRPGVGPSGVTTTTVGVGPPSCERSGVSVDVGVGVVFWTTMVVPVTVGVTVLVLVLVFVEVDVGVRVRIVVVQ